MSASAIESRERRWLSVHDFPLSQETLDDFDGWCLELVNELLHSHPEGFVREVFGSEATWEIMSE